MKYVVLIRKVLQNIYKIIKVCYSVGVAEHLCETIKP